MPRRPLPQRSRHRGFALMALLVLLTLGGLYFFVNNLTPAAVAERRQQQTSAALNQARDALLGYALKYREDQIAQQQLDRVYGYLPLPDLGTATNNNPDDNCKDPVTSAPLEGCDAVVNTTNQTVIGRFPWRTLGTGPLKDGNGECLWYVVSGSHDRIQRPAPMNWDTLSHLDIVVANGTSALVSALASAHDRPIAIVFSPGAALSTQSRTATSPATDDVTECGGNYDAKNYLDPVDATSLGSVTNFFSGTTNSATGATTALDAGLKKFSAQGVIQRDAAANLWARNCAPGSCSIVSNDTGLSLTGDNFFSTLRNSSLFRIDINSMLDRMTACLRDKIAGGGTPAVSLLPGFPVPADKSFGRISTHTCYDENTSPLGYFSNYSNQIFVAKPNSGSFAVTVDGVENTNCAGVIMFSNQRDSGTARCPSNAPVTIQKRTTATEIDTPCNYLEGSNLVSVESTGTSFSGASLFARTPSVQSSYQDIVRCIPSSASFSSVNSPALSSGGFSQLSGYNLATRTLTLGALGVRSNNGAPAYALFGCSWTPETHATGSGLRTYFRVKIVDRGDGFVFAMIDGDRNSANVCGAGRQHLGYSGNNDPDQSSNGLVPSTVGNETAIVEYPKFGIEFDNTKASGTVTTSGNPLIGGRNDPDYTPPLANDAHAAIVYWGGDLAISTGTACNASQQCPYTGNCSTLGNCPAVRYCNTVDNMCYLRPEYDDNVHGNQAGVADALRPPLTNPPAIDPFPNPVTVPASGLVPLDRLHSTTASERDFHVRVELTRSYSGSPTDAKDRSGTYKVEAWILPESATVANQIAAMKNVTRPMSQLYPTFASTLSNDGIRYDEPHGACGVGDSCASGQSCSSGICYSNGPTVIRDLPMGACDALQRCSGPPLLKHSACTAGNACPSGQSCGADNFCYDALYTCGSDNVCYGEAFRTMRLGFTNGQGTQDQVIDISDFFTTWLP